jgi:hypothetical protein
MGAPASFLAPMLWKKKNTEQNIIVAEINNPLFNPIRGRGILGQLCSLLQADTGLFRRLDSMLLQAGTNIFVPVVQIFVPLVQIFDPVVQIFDPVVQIFDPVVPT